MTRRFDSPFEKYADSFIELPDEWLGLHARRRDEAVEAANGKSQTLLEFAIALALLDEWDLPGLNGNPEKWDFEQLPLEVIVWVNQTVLRDFGRCFIVPKESSPPSMDG